MCSSQRPMWSKAIAMAVLLCALAHGDLHGQTERDAILNGGNYHVVDWSYFTDPTGTRWYIAPIVGGKVNVHSLGKIVNGKAGWWTVGEAVGAIALAVNLVSVDAGLDRDSSDTFFDAGLQQFITNIAIHADRKRIQASTVPTRWFFFQAPNGYWYIVNAPGQGSKTQIRRFGITNGKYDWRITDTSDLVAAFSVNGSRLFVRFVATNAACHEPDVATILQEYTNDTYITAKPTCSDFNSEGGSPNFTWEELNRTPGSGHKPWAWIRKELLDGLERTRSKYGETGDPRIKLTSGFRCPHGNKLVGSKERDSKHMHGIAADMYGLRYYSNPTESEFNILRKAARDAGATTTEWSTYEADRHLHAQFGSVASGAVFEVITQTDCAVADECELIAQVSGDDAELRAAAIRQIRDIGVGRLSEELRGFVIAALDQEATLHARRRRGEVGELEQTDLIVELGEIVAEMHEPSAIPALANALGTAAPSVRALSEFGESVVPTLAKVASDASEASVLMDAIECLRTIAHTVGSAALDPKTAEMMSEVAEERLTEPQESLTTVWRAIELAAALNDPHLQGILESLAFNPDGAMLRGIADPELAAYTKRVAREALARELPLPRAAEMSSDYSHVPDIPCYRVSLSTTPTGGGSAQNARAQDCSGGYTGGTDIEIHASPKAGYRFSKWSVTKCRIANGDDPSTTCTVTGAGDVSIVAVFEPSTTPQTCTSFTLVPASINTLAAAGARTISVVGSPSGCQGGTWSITDNSPWLSANPATGGGPNSTVTVSWNHNPSTSSRTDSLEIARRTLTVTQSGISGATFSPHPFVPVTGAIADSHRLGVGPDGTVYVLYPRDDRDALYVVRSSDGAMTWSSPVTVPNSDHSNFDFDFAVDPSGVLHVVWAEYGDDQVYYSRSTDSGVTFSSPVAARRGNSNSGYRTDSGAVPVVAGDSSGRVYIAFRARTLDSSGNRVGFYVWLSRCGGSCTSFENEVPVGSLTGGTTRPAAISATGTNVYVLYRDSDADDLYCARFDATGTLHGTARVNPTPDFVDSGDIAVSPDQTTLYSAYTDENGDYEGNVTFCRSTDGGQTWTGCRRVNDSTRRYQVSPELGVDQSGRVHVVWDDLRGLHMAAFYSQSSDDGTSFSLNESVSIPFTENRFYNARLAVDDATDSVYISAEMELDLDTEQIVVARRAVALPPQQAPAAPTAVAAAMASARVEISWPTVAGATEYEVDRKSAGGDYTPIGRTPSNTFADTTASANAAHLYRVRAMNDAGISPSSVADLATTVEFDDSPLIPGTIVRVRHFAQLRTAVDAVRSLAGLALGTYGEAPATGMTIKATLLSQLRENLDGAFAALGMPSGGYTTPFLQGSVVRAVHVQELRARLR